MLVIGLDKEKVPSAEVVVPWVVLCQKRLAPAIGSPKLSFTVPFTCACKAVKENRRMAIKLYFISVLYLKK